MELSNKLDREEVDRFVDYRLKEWPPRPLFKAALSLERGEKITHGLARSVEDTDEGTTWTLFALTESRFILITGSAPESNWRWESELHLAHSLRATSRPIRAIRSMSVTAVKHLSRGFNDDSSWTADYELEFDDGTVITLPKATEASEPTQRESIEEFVSALLERTTQ